MEAFLIDELGQAIPTARVWQEIAPQLTRRAFEAFSVRNMGFAAIERRASGVRVTVRAAIIAGPTQAALIGWLAEALPSRVLVSLVETAPRSKLCRGAHEAIAYLVDEIGNAQLATSELRRMPRALEALDGAHPFVMLTRLWQDLGGAYRREVYRDVLRDVFADRYILVAMRSDIGQLVVREAGMGFSVLDTQWMARASGRRVADQPDVRYGRWAAQAYREALAAGAPKLESIDAVIKQPGAQRVRACYERLILPCTMPDGGQVLLGASLMQDRVALAR